MNIKDSYIHNGTAVLKDIKIENSILKKILAGKGANDQYLDWTNVLDLTTIKPTNAGNADTLGSYAHTAFLKLTGGTMTGKIDVSYNNSSILDSNHGLNFAQVAHIGIANTDFGIYTTGGIYLRPNQTWGSANSNGLVITSSNITYNANSLLHAGNYTSYVYSKSQSDSRYVLKAGDTMTGALTVPSLTVTGASTFSQAINGSILGNAATASRLLNARTISLSGSVTGSGSFDGSGNLSIATTTNHEHKYIKHDGKALNDCIPDVVDSMQSFRCTSSSTDFGDGYILAWRWSSGLYITQLFADVDANYGLCYRYRSSAGEWANWKRIPMGDGTGASGTWGINITGSAGSVAWGNVSNKPDTATRWPSWSEVTSKPVVFLDLGWNTNTLYTDANTTASIFGLITNLLGNYTSNISGYPTNYGYMLFFNNGGSTYTGILIYQGTDDQTRIRYRWSSSGWKPWRILIDSSSTQTISGNKTFNSSVSIDDLTAGNLVVTGGASFALTINGNITSADKVNHSLTILLNSGTTEGTNKFTFNGSANKSINITPSAIGAQASGNYVTTDTTLTITGTKTFSDTLTVKNLTISNTDAADHIKFSRTTYNYITTPSGGCIVFEPDGVGVAASYGMTMDSTGFRPSTTKGYSLGTSSLYWNNIYGTSIYLNGTALSSAATHAHGDYVISITYDSTNKKLQLTKGGGSATDIVTFGSNAFNSTSYLPLTAGSSNKVTGDLYLSSTSVSPAIIFERTQEGLYDYKIFSNGSGHLEIQCNKGGSTWTNYATFASDGSFKVGTGIITTTKISNWDSVYTWYTTAAGTSASGVIDNWNEIKNFIDGFHETDDLAEYLVNTFVAKTGGTMTGALTTPSLTVTGAATFLLTINGSILGNAATASRLLNVRTITVGSTSKSFDGSANISFTLSEIGALAAGSYVTISGTLTISGAKTFSNTVVVGSTSDNKNIEIHGTGVFENTAYGSQLEIWRRTDGANAVISYYNGTTKTLLGYIGISGDTSSGVSSYGRPYWCNGTTNYQLVHSTAKTAVGGTTTPIYIDTNGQAQTCTAYSSASVATATRLTQSTISALSSFTHTTDLIYAAAGGSNSVTDKPSDVDAFGVLSFKTADGWYGQILASSNTATGLYYRTATSFSGNWKRIIDSTMYDKYADGYIPKLGLFTTTGYYYIPAVGTTITLTSGSSDWRKGRIPVKSGDVFYIKGRGGYDPDLYTFTDTNSVVKSVSGDGLQWEGAYHEITAGQDGFLYYNFNASYSYGIISKNWLPYYLHEANYTDYTVTKTGGGASGTWGISISGSAGSAYTLSSWAESSGTEDRYVWHSWSDNTAKVAYNSGLMFNPNNKLLKIVSTTGYTYIGDGYIKINKTNAADPTANYASIEFSYGGSQEVYLGYTPNDSYRASKGLKVWGSSDDNSNCWFEVGGSIYSEGGHKVLNANNYTSYAVSLSGTLIISGNKTFSSSVSIDSLTAGNLVVTGGASFALTINGSISGNADTVDNMHALLFGYNKTSESYDCNEVGTHFAAYRFSSSPTNAFPSSAYGNMLVIGADSDTMTLIGCPYSSDNIYFRTGTWYSNGTGSIRTNAWKTIIHSGNIGSQSVSYASSAGSVAWGNITSKPIRLDEYITSNDLSTSTYNGFGRIPSSSPFTVINSSNTDCMTVNIAYSSAWAGQIAADYRSNNLAYRNKNNGTWNSWAIMLTDKNYFEIGVVTKAAANYSLSSGDWVDAGITFPTEAGSYVLTLISGNLTATGVFSVGTSDGIKDEIALHLHGPSTYRLYARTDGNKLYLASSDSTAASRNITIKYKRLI